MQMIYNILHCLATMFFKLSAVVGLLISRVRAICECSGCRVFKISDGCDVSYPKMLYIDRCKALLRVLHHCMLISLMSKTKAMTFCKFRNLFSKLYFCIYKSQIGIYKSVLADPPGGEKLARNSQF